MRAWGRHLLHRAVRARSGRRVLAVLGVATSALLVLVLLGSQRGLSEGVRTYVGQPDVDLWVAPRGTDNLIRSSGLLPLAFRRVVEELPGVQRVDPVRRGFVRAQGDDTGLTLLAMGYRGPDGLGGPPELAAGRRPASPDEVALDRAAAARLDVGLDDIVTLGTRELTVVGLSRGTNLVGTQFVFLDGTLDEKSAGLTAQVSFLLVTAEPGVDVETVRAAIEARLGSARAWPTEAFVDRNLEELLSGLRPFLVLVAGMSVISATLLVELLVQGAIDERRQELAVLLALGVPLSEITVAVLIEAGGLALMGSLIGAFVALGLQGALDAGVAALDLHPTALDAVWVGLGLIASSAVGGLIPMLRLRRIDPGEAFRP